jgi:two-component system nitrate/nitrite response regulator NarL
MGDSRRAFAQDGNFGRGESLRAEQVPRQVLIVSDIRILRESLAEAIAKDSSFLVVGIVSALEEALGFASLEAAQIILVDAALPEGSNAVTRLRELSAGAKIIAFGLSETEDAVINWAEAGVCGYVPRNAPLVDLVAFIDSIFRGEQICSSRVAAGLLRRIAAGPAAARGQSGREAESSLTSREQEVARCLGAGLSNKEIARRLNIGLATTKSHVHSVLGKLMLERRSQVSRWILSNPLSLGSGRGGLPPSFRSRGTTDST